MLQQEVLIETELDLKDIDNKFFRLLKQFEPFGPQNEAPILLTRNVRGAGYIVGTNHIKITIKQEDSMSFDCIGFGLADYINYINAGHKFDICYTIE